MYTLDNILVCLDLSDMDDFLIRYCNFVVESFQPKHITFMHVMMSHDVPPELLKEMPHLDVNLEDLIKEELQEKVDQFFGKLEQVAYRIVVTEGNTTETIIQYAQEQDITLTIMGKKIGYTGHGGVVRKVMSLTPSSVLIVSETTQPRLERILVRMDFSKISGMALKMALRIRELIQSDIRISCQHVYKLPLSYFPQQTALNEEKMRRHLTRYGEKEYLKFLKKYNLEKKDIACEHTLDLNNDEAQVLYHYAMQNGADLILIGSKVKSELADIILDSTSEKLAGVEKNIPVMVVKDRKETIGFLEALFDL